MPGLYIQYPLSQVPIVSEILVPGSGDQCNSIPLSCQTDVFCVGRYHKLCTLFSVYCSNCHDSL